MQSARLWPRRRPACWRFLQPASFEEDENLKVTLLGTEVQGSWSQDGRTVTVTSADESREPS